MPPRPPKGSSASANQHAYIPQGAQQALARQMQQSVPAHLKQYVNNSNGYVPPRVQQELTSYMEAALPQHLQQYAGAYVEQNVVVPSMSQRPGAVQPSSFRAHNKPTNPRNLSHSGAVGSSQGDAEQMLGLFQPEHQRPKQTSEYAQASVVNQPTLVSEPQLEPAKTPPPPIDPATIPAGQLAVPYESTNAAPIGDPAHYEFIMNPTEQKPKAKGLGGGSGSLITKIAVIGGIGVFLIIAIVVVSSLLKGSGGSQTSIVTVAQEQTELIRIAQLGPVNSDDDKTLQLANALTINLLSAQSQTLSYLKLNHTKYDTKLLGLKHSAQTDSALNAAAASSNFDSVFREVVKNDLAQYANTLKQAYGTTTGPKGKALLQSQYDGANLLLEQASN